MSYGGKLASTNNRGIVNIITDNRATKGATTLYANVLHRSNGGSEKLVVKIWGVRESVSGQWDGWIDLSGPAGNTDGLDLRNYNNALAPDAVGQTSSTVAPSYTGSDFTPLLVADAAGLGITPSDSWQPVQFPINLGATGYDQIVVGFAFSSTSGTRSGVDQLGTQTSLPLNFFMTAAPPQLTTGQTAISLTWGIDNPTPGGTYIIISDQPGFGPYDVTPQTTNGMSTTPFVVNYNPPAGDVNFTLTLSRPGGPVTRSALVKVPRPQPVLTATPSPLTPQDHSISLTWATTDYPANANVVITSNRAGIGFFNVAGQTGSNGSSTSSLAIPYPNAVGDITFTISVTNPANGITGTSDLVVKAPAAALPNVVVILVDDMGWADISPYGGEISTPNIKRLSDHGMRFRNFYNEARCAPTRNALLSGLHVQTSATDPNNELPPMRIDNNVSIPEMLRTVGYRNYLSGKWHLSDYVNFSNYTPLSSPTHRGFDYAFNASLWGGNLADHHGLGLYWGTDNFNLYPPNAEIAPIRYDGTDSRASRVPFFKTDANTDYALVYINHNNSKNDGKPFFLYLAYQAPHFFLQAPKERINRYTDVGDANPGDTDIYKHEAGWDVTRQLRYERQLATGVIPPGTRLPPLSPNPGGPVVPAWNTLPQDCRDDLSRRMATYAALVEGVDINVGRIIDKLEQTGQLNNTIILFMSDNGGNAEGGVYGNVGLQTGTDLTEMGQPGRPELQLGGAWANVSNTPFRYFKHYTHEGGCHTPMIAHWPAGIPANLEGTWTEERGHVIDLMPTLLEAVGLRYPQNFAGHPVEPFQGTSLLPALRGGKLPQRDLEVEHERNRAFFRGEWKLVTKNISLSAIDELPADAVELYNLKTDPTEMNNLSFHQPQMLASMTAAFNE